jgi:hypothetical protein
VKKPENYNADLSLVGMKLTNDPLAAEFARWHRVLQEYEEGLDITNVVDLLRVPNCIKCDDVGTYLAHTKIGDALMRCSCRAGFNLLH